MSVIEPATLGQLLSCAVSVAMVISLTHQSGPRYLFRALWLAGVASILWGVTAILSNKGTISEDSLVEAVFWARNLAWVLVLLLSVAEVQRVPPGQQRSRPGNWAALSAVVVIGIIVVSVVLSDAMSLERTLGLLVSLVAFATFETVIRNSPRQFRLIAAYICIASTGVFLPLLFVSLPVAFGERAYGVVDDAYGYLAAISAMPLVLALRVPIRPIELKLEGPRYVYQPLFFISFAIVVLALLVGDYYVRSLGGTWAEVTRVAFIACVVTFLGASAFSPSVRGQIRVFLTKSFLRYKYDYRKEWLRFIGTLSETGLEHLNNNAVRSIARIVNSPAGVVWVIDTDSKRYTPIGTWQCALPLERTFSAGSSLVRFMVERQWVIDLSEMRKYPSLYGDLQVDNWFNKEGNWWIVVPLLLGNDLYGFVALQHGISGARLNFEDHDLLRTVGRHVASHLKQAESDKKLSEAQQFSTYHRLSAFLMHDLNNLAAQLSLLVRNAEKHRDDPKFVDDMIATVTNSAARMNRLLEQLSKGGVQAKVEDVELVPLLQKSIQQSQGWRPLPIIQNNNASLHVSADPDRLGGVLEHLIRNAQDATEDTGTVELEVGQDQDWAVIKIRDTGCGMTEEFISERLFRPFDSTKGSQSMGIGAYQAREYIRELGGQIDVVSASGRGTTFTIYLPVLTP